MNLTPVNVSQAKSFILNGHTIIAPPLQVLPSVLNLGSILGLVFLF